jgi:hypothetical protein
MDKIYVGSGVGKFENKLVEFSVCLSDLPKEHIFEYKGKKYIKLKVQQKKEIDQFGKSHSVEVNTWKPEKKETQQVNNNPGFEETDDLPF